jgi:hypothetical protein
VAAEPARGEGGTLRAPTDPLAGAVFAVLVLGCFAAFLITQHLKHTPTAVQDFKRTPTFAPASARGEAAQEHLSFKLAEADQASVTIINSSGATVATLLSDRPLPRYKQFSLRWNGRTGAPSGYRELTLSPGHQALLPLNTGPLAPPGEYRVRVRLRREDKEVLSPWSFTLVGQ